MYLSLGQNTVVKKRNIIGIFDLDTSTVKKPTRDFLKTNEQNGQIINICSDLPNSFILYSEYEESKVINSDKKKNKSRIYISSVSSSTLGKRIL